MLDESELLIVFGDLLQRPFSRLQKALLSGSYIRYEIDIHNLALHFSSVSRGQEGGCAISPAEAIILGEELAGA